MFKDLDDQKYKHSNEELAKMESLKLIVYLNPGLPIHTVA